MRQSWIEDLVGTERLGVLSLLVAFVVTTALTRVTTRRIRARRQAMAAAAAARSAATEAVDTEGGGRGGFLKDIHIGGVHVHHQVWGIMLCLVVGLLLVTYSPSPGWGLNVLGALFGAGAALALDEFAMWLHLEDVYWSHEGRASITALMTAAAIALTLVLGANPLDLGSSSNEGLTAWVIAVGAIGNFGFAVACILKGKNQIALIGIFVPFLALVGAIRLAKPGSWWARRRYAAGSRKDRRSRDRFDAAYEARWRRIRDAIGGAPTEP